MITDVYHASTPLRACTRNKRTDHAAAKRRDDTAAAPSRGPESTKVDHLATAPRDEEPSRARERHHSTIRFVYYTVPVYAPRVPRVSSPPAAPRLLELGTMGTVSRITNHHRVYNEL